jgi:hypothetical protein
MVAYYPLYEENIYGLQFNVRSLPMLLLEPFVALAGGPEVARRECPDVAPNVTAWAAHSISGAEGRPAVPSIG